MTDAGSKSKFNGCESVQTLRPSEGDCTEHQIK